MKHLLPSAVISILLILMLTPRSDAGSTYFANRPEITSIPLTTLLTFEWLQDSAHSAAADKNEASSHDGPGDDYGYGTPDLGQQRAAELAVPAPPAWYGKVIWGSGLLFVLAATLGSAAIVLKGPEPPDPADDQGHH